MYALTISISSVSVGLFTLGINTGYERNINLLNSIDEKKQYLFTICLTLATLYTALILLVKLFKHLDLFNIFFNSEIDNLLLPAFYLSSVQSLKQIVYVFIRYGEEHYTYLISILSDCFLMILISYLLVVNFGYGIDGILYGFFLSNLFVVSGIILWLIKDHKIRLFRTSMALSTLKMSYRLSFRSILSIFSNNFDKFIIASYGSFNTLGIYYLGQRIGTFSFMFLTALQNVYGPSLYKLMFKYNADFKNRISDYLKKPLAITILFSTVISVFSEEIFILLGLESFLTKELIFISVTFSYINCFTFFGKIPALMYNSRVNKILKYSVISTATLSLFQTFFLIYYGIYGLLFGLMLASILNVIVLYNMNQKSFTLNWNSYILFIIFGVFFINCVIYMLSYYFEVYYYLRLFLKFLILAESLILLNKLKYLTLNDFKLRKYWISTNV